MGQITVADDHDPKKPLPNEFHERICQERCRGFSQEKSYLRAIVVEEGKEVKVSRDVARTQCWRLFQKHYMQSRLAYLKKQMLKNYKNLDKAIEKKYMEAIANKTFTNTEHLTALRDASKYIGKGTEQHNHVHQGSITIKNNFGSEGSE